MEYELKFDGYRAIAFKTRNRVHVLSRNGKDFSQRLPALVRALEPLADETVIDGKIIRSGWHRASIIQSAAELGHSRILPCVLSRIFIF
ncbi:MAG: hypothetical protein WAN81_11400 [Candidatus Binataceae bacterium]